MLQSEYLDIAIELYDIYSEHDIHHKKWLSARELAKLKGGPGLIAKVKRGKGLLSELKQLISTITFFQLGARTKELKTIKLKLKNQLKEMESK